MDKDFTSPKKPNGAARPAKPIAPPSRPGNKVTPNSNADKDAFSDMFEGELPAVDETGTPISRKNRTDRDTQTSSPEDSRSHPGQSKHEELDDDIFNEFALPSSEEPYIKPKQTEPPKPAPAPKPEYETYTPQPEQVKPVARTPEAQQEHSNYPPRSQSNTQRSNRELQLPETMMPRPQNNNSHRELVPTSQQRTAPRTQQENEKRDPRNLFMKAKGERKASKKALNPRQTATILRTIVMLAILLFATLGIYNIVNPISVPSGAELNNAINQSTGKSNFPTDKAEGFILAFTEAYFTKTEGLSSTDYSNKLIAFAPDSLVTEMRTSYTGDTTQTVLEGPYVSGIRYVDDNMASYTMSVKLSTSENWVYVQIPVYYNEESKSFTVAGIPGLVPEPPRSKLPSGYAKTWSTDTKIAQEVQADFQKFFTAWGASDQEELARLLSPEASLEAKTGLNGEVEFISLTEIEVQMIADDPNFQLQRLARVKVRWGTPEETSYTSFYEMLIDFDGTRWNVRDIRAGVPS